MIETIMGFAGIAFSIERATEYLFNIVPLKTVNEVVLKKYSIKMLVAGVFGLVISYFSGLDIVNVFLGKEGTDMTGTVLTGLLLGGGANVFSDIISFVQSSKKMFTK